MRGHQLRLIALLVAAVLPVVAIASVLVVYVASQERRAVEAEIEARAVHLADLVDRETGAQLRVLQALATSASLDGPDLRAFHAEARRVLSSQSGWLTIILLDLDGWQLLSARQPVGRPPVRVIEPASYEEVLRTGAPVVGGISEPSPAGVRAVPLRVPVMREGQVRHVLTAAASPESIGRLLRDEAAAIGWAGRVVDRQGRVVTSIPGTSGGASLLADEHDALVASAVTTIAGWTVHLSTSRAARDGPRQRAVVAASLGGALCVALAAALAWLVQHDLAAYRSEKAEAALRRSEEQRRLALDAAGLGLWDVDYITGQIAHSGRFAELYGIGPDETVTPELAWTRIHPDDMPRLRDAVARAKDPASDGGYEAEYRVCLPDGGERWHLARARVHFEGKGPARRPVRFVGVVMDTTERKRAEAALRESEQRLRATQENAGVGISEVDAEGRFLRVNEAICVIAGYPRDELIGRSVFDVSHPEDAAFERAAYARLVAGEADTYEREKRYIRKDRSERWVEVATTAVHDAEGRFLYGVRVVQDIHDRKLAEQRQRLLLDELNHRVKNTLAVVRSIAAQTVTEGRTLAEARVTLQERLRALAATHDLLTGNLWRGASLRALAEAELRPYAGRACATGPDLTLAPKTVLSLGLVLHELATNAAKHGALSAPEGRVELSWTLDDTAGELRLCWRERHGPPVTPPARRGFGRTLLEQGLRHELGGEVRMTFEPAGLVCEILVPAAAALAEAGSGDGGGGRESSPSTG